MVDGIYGIKDTYVVCKYVKKTVLELGFMGFRHLPGPFEVCVNWDTSPLTSKKPHLWTGF
jgi:hypothetical protein